MCNSSAEGIFTNNRILNAGLVLLIFAPLVYFAFDHIPWVEELLKDLRILAYGSWFCYSVAAIVCCFTPVPEDIGGLYQTFRFKKLCVLDSVPNVMNIYSDIAVAITLTNEGSEYLSYYYVTITCILLYRISSTGWVWIYFHRIDYAIYQFFEFFTFFEMYRIAKSQVVLLSLFRLKELALVVEDLPMFMINIIVIQDKASKQEAVPTSVYASLILTVISSCMMTRDLDLFMWKHYVEASKSSGGSLVLILRACESLSSFATISFLTYHFGWIVALIIMGIQALFFYSMQSQSTFYNIERAIIWIFRVPILAYGTTWHYLIQGRYKRIAQAHIRDEAEKFYKKCNEKLLSEPWFGGEEYAMRMASIYDDYSFTMPEVSPPFFPKWSLWDMGIWKKRFYKVHIRVRICYNMVWFIVFLTQWSKIEPWPRWIYFFVALITNLGCLIMSCLVEAHPIERYQNEDFAQADFPLHFHANSMSSQSIEDMMNMENLVYLGYELEVFNPKGESILTHCARINNPEMIKYLLRAGFDANAHDALGQLPLCQAIRFGHRDCIDAFLPTTENGKPAEIYFAPFGKPVVDVNAQSQGAYKMTPLHLCAIKCDVETAQNLIDRNADINIEARHGNLFHMAFDSRESAEQKIEFIKRLTAWNCDINATINPQEIADQQLQRVETDTTIEIDEAIAGSRPSPQWLENMHISKRTTLLNNAQRHLSLRQWTPEFEENIAQMYSLSQDKVDQLKAWVQAQNKFCRICGKLDDKENLIVACGCKGELKYMHQCCFRNWYAEQTDWWQMQCKTCREFYRESVVDAILKVYEEKIEREVVKPWAFKEYVNDDMEYPENAIDRRQQATFLRKVAGLLGKIGDRYRQKQLLQQALDIKKEALGESHYEVKNLRGYLSAIDQYIDVSYQKEDGFAEKDVTILWRCIQDFDKSPEMYLAIIKALLKAHADPAHECCPLLAAIEYNASPEVARLLIERKADINMHDEYGYTLLEIASTAPQIDENTEEWEETIERKKSLVLMLLDAGLDPNQQKLQGIFGETKSAETPSGKSVLEYMKDEWEFSPDVIKTVENYTLSNSSMINIAGTSTPAVGVTANDIQSTKLADSDSHEI